MIRFSRLSAIAVTCAAFAGAAIAADYSDKQLADAVKARKAQMGLLSYNLGILGAMAKAETPYDADVASAAAQNLATISALELSVLWLEGSEQGFVDGSRAKTEIWSDPAGFEEDAIALAEASAAMADVAGSGLDGLRGGMAAVGSACGACHDDYRGPRN